jgi:hypothetical protein
VYDLVVVPPAMENWNSATLKLMEEYLAAGGRVLAMTVPTHVNGRVSNAPAELARRYAGQWSTYASAGDVTAQIRTLVRPYLSAPDGGALPAGLAWRRAAMADGDAAWFLANPWNQGITAEVSLPGAAAIELDTSKAVASELQCTKDDGHLTVRLTLPPRAHSLLYVPREPVAGVSRKQQRAIGSPVALGQPSIQRLDDNVLVLDYCDVESRRGKLADVATIHADAQNWQWQGFDGSPWRQGYQFKRTIIDRPVAADSGFVVQYRLLIADSLPDSALGALRVGIERSELYRSTLNGQELRDPEAWFDEAMRAFRVGGIARRGENVLRLEARPMHMLAQIMPVYVLGEFGVVPVARGSEVGAARELELGLWSDQGLCFYPGAVRYSFPFMLDQTAEALEVQLGEWAGTVAAVQVDGGEQGVIMHPPYRVQLVGPFLAGQHELRIEVTGNMRNMMGPHHADGLAGAWTWDRCPVHQPAGDRYQFVRTGMLGPPTCAMLK